MRYNVELEEHEPSTPPIPNRLINEIEALIVNDKNIEINGATREEMFPVDKLWSWGAAFIDEFYKMIYKKWDIVPHFPNIEYQHFMEDINFVTNSAQGQLDHDFRYKYFSDDFSIEDNPENNIEQGADKETSVLSDRPIDERKKTQWDKYNQLLLQGLPPINPTFKVSIVEITNRPNPNLYHQTEESSNSEIGAIDPNSQITTRRGMSEWRKTPC